ncbi:hypothetical protein [Streptomyces meridianus]|uniref:DUF7847 domain-containing protein n=1 Tax=Streptomyces meridianus TaxID=2938945 RepID=A0ABT0X4W0_9ACTN|nr:hypothetical protein [Streptomyces meridianus]MCM2577584.1 hypothetical protein [Streptomyces meridianus]
MSKDQGWEPSGNPAAGGQGWGGGAPYGGPPGGWGWAPPPPPKPGVIPLAPLSVGDIVSGSFSAMTRYWKPLFGTAGAVYGGLAALIVLGLGLGYLVVSDHVNALFDLPDGTDPDPADLIPVLVAFGVVYLLAVIALLIASAVGYASCAVVVREAVLGRDVTFGAVWRQAWARVPSVIGAVLLSGLAAFGPVLVGMIAAMVAAGVFAVGGNAQDAGSVFGIAMLVIFLVLLPLGIWIHIRFCLAPQAVVFEPQRAVAAMRRSVRLVRGSWWRVFGITALGFVIGVGLSYAVSIPFTIVGMIVGFPGMATMGPEPDLPALFASMGLYMTFVMTGSMIGQIVAQVFSSLVTGLVYVDQRIRREDLVSSLAAAVGIPSGPEGPSGPATPGPTPEGPGRPPAEGHSAPGPQDPPAPPATGPATG